MLKFIIALDFFEKNEALALVKKLDPRFFALKLGSQIFTSLGPDFVKGLVENGYKVFLDLKFHDIPNTVAKACVAAAKLGVWMMNVHASGGFSMMQAASHALKEACPGTPPLLLAVTVLTSLDTAALKRMGRIEDSLEAYVGRLAIEAKAAGLDGVVSSAYEVPLIKSLCGPDFLTVTPGIRLDNDSKDEQARVLTPMQALSLGADFLVLGRSVLRSTNPEKLLNRLLELVNQ